MSVRVEHGDMRDVLPGLLAQGVQVDSVVCDPPYHLQSIVKRFAKTGRTESTRTTSGPHQRTANGFMGKQWDGGDIAFQPETWRLVYDVMKPGAHLIAFGGTRTYHRMACAIEDAGFDVRDMISWLYGSGFPKSHNVGDGLGTALKPACEPTVLARKPLIGTVAANVLKHGTGALNIGACRVGTSGGSERPSGMDRYNAALADQGYRPATYQRGAPAVPSPAGRWPANVIHDGSDEVLAAFPQTDGGGDIHRRSAPKTSGVYGAFAGDDDRWAGYADTGTAARFFYTAKATKADRLGSRHPTVKPVNLMRYLCRLVTPPGGTVLDPFAGSGTTGMACMAEGFDAILIEREAEYIADIHRRLQHVQGTDDGLFAPLRDDETSDLFGSDAA